MAEITDIENEFIRQEIEEYIERPDERQRTINTFAKARPAMQLIAAALIDGDNETVDPGSYGLWAYRGDGYCGHQV
jgi:hypothetical protein